MPKFSKKATILHLSNQIALLDKLISKYTSERAALQAKLDEVNARPE